MYGEKIMELRKSNGWSQKDLASKLECSVKRIINIEKGRREISARELMILSEVFNVSIDRMLNNKSVRSFDRIEWVMNFLREKNIVKDIDNVSIDVTKLIMDAVRVELRMDEYYKNNL